MTEITYLTYFAYAGFACGVMLGIMSSTRAGRNRRK